MFEAVVICKTVRDAWIDFRYKSWVLVLGGVMYIPRCLASECWNR